MGIFMQAAHAICRKPPVALAMVVLESCTECVTRAASAQERLVGRRIFGAKSFEEENHPFWKAAQLMKD
jgi:hypothetical protein